MTRESGRGVVPTGYVGVLGSPPGQATWEKRSFRLSLRFPAPLHWAYNSGMAAAFDTLSAAKELQAAGFDQAQAEAVARTVRAGQGDLATKDDVTALRTEMGALGKDVDALGKDVSALRAELGSIKWALGLVAALNVAIPVRLLLV